MVTPEQIQLAVRLIRKQSQVMRGERRSLLRLMNSLAEARAAGIPESFLLPFSSTLCALVDCTPFDRAFIPASISSLFNQNSRHAAYNMASLESFGARILEEFGTPTQEAVLAGDGAILAGLYQDPGAFQASNWAALLPDGTCANGARQRMFAPPSVEWSENIRLGNAFWRKPKPALLTTLLAAHVGDPASPPIPFTWPHLGLALLLWHDKVSAGELCSTAKTLGCLEEVERGLAVTVQIFPELVGWLEAEKLEIPRWERQLAIPIAAKRLLVGDRD